MSNLVKDTEMTPMQEESFRMIISSGDLLLAIVNDVLDFAKLETENVDIDIGLCSFQETLISVIHSIEMKAHSTQTVQPFLDAALPEFVHMDSRRLQQVLFNLLGNAVKFSPDNGVVEFSVALIQCDPTPMSCLSKSTSTASLDLDVKNAIMIDDIEKDGDFSSPPSRCPFHKEPTIVEVASASPIPKACLRFIVKDYGKGIDKTDFDRIFQPFQQAPLGKEEVSGGTGLGLAITHKLVTAMGGSISVDSVKGSWSSFTVDLPFLDDKVNLNDLASTMQTWDVSLVGLPCAKQDNVRRIFSAYDVEATMFGSLENLVVGMPKEGIGRIHVCLVHEDSFDTVICKKLRESPVKTRILSFGPNFSVNATESLHHFRSIESILPSVLMKIMINNISFDVKPETRRTTVSIDTSCLEKVRVLVAEDNVVNQKVLFKMLERMGVKHIDMANNGLIACEKEEVQNPPYDIILMDQQMPIMGGVDACRRIVNRIGTHTRPKVVFVTAHVSPQFEEECIDAGGSGFLPKPFKLEQITSCFQTFFATTNKS